MKVSPLVLSSLITAVLAKNVYNPAQHRPADGESVLTKRLVMPDGDNFDMSVLSDLFEEVSEETGVDIHYVDLGSLLESLGAADAVADAPESAKEVLIPVFKDLNLDSQEGRSKSETRNVVPLSVLQAGITTAATSPMKRDAREYLEQLISWGSDYFDLDEGEIWYNPDDYDIFNDDVKLYGSRASFVEDMRAVAAAKHLQQLTTQEQPAAEHQPQQILKEEQTAAAAAAAPDGGADDSSAPDMSPVPLLQSALPQVKDISIFAGYIRDQIEIAQLTSQVETPLVIVAPSNHAISKKLGGLKPWEFPYDIEKDEANAERNLKHFVESHVVQQQTELSLADWDAFFQATDPVEVQMQSINGNTVTFVRRDGKTAVYNFEVVRPETANGELPVPYSILEHTYKVGDKYASHIVYRTVAVEHGVLDMVRVDNGYILVMDDSLVLPKSA